MNTLSRYIDLAIHYVTCYPLQVAGVAFTVIAFTLLFDGHSRRVL